MNARHSIFSALVWCAATGAIAQSLPPALDKIRSTGEVVIGYRSDGSPFSYDVAGVTGPVGYAIDLCKSVVAALQRETRLPALRTRYVAVSNAQRFPALQKGQIDLECADTTNTRERRDKLGMAFSIPYYIAGTRMLVRTDSKLERMQDMNGKTAITTKGTTSVSIVRERETALSYQAPARRV